MEISFEIYKKLNYFDLDVSFSMGNELLVIEGPSGAGKTTILNCLAGIVSPDRGLVKVGEKTLFDSKKKICIPAEKRDIGYLFQSYALFPHMTVKKNILYGLKNKKEYRDRSYRQEMLEYADYIMENLGISHLEDKYPASISGGERQRTALARAMVTKPSLLLMDEPFSALDNDTRESIYEEFGDFKNSFSIPTILITHNHRETELFADKTLIIKEGRFI